MKNAYGLVCRCLLASCLVLAASVASAFEYKGPVDCAASIDGKMLYVVEMDAAAVSAVDLGQGQVAASIPMPSTPTGVCVSPDGKTLYVTCGAPEGTVAVVDIESGEVTAEIAVGHSPRGPCVSPDGSTLYVCNRFDNDVSVVDLGAKKESARVACLREPYDSAITPDGRTVFVSNHLPIDPSDSYDVACEVTAIDTATRETSQIRLLNGTTDLSKICVSPDGRYVYTVSILARYQMPTTQLERGWMNTNALSIIDAQEKKFFNTVLLDDIDLGAANPYGVACSDDSSKVFVTHAGTHELSVIDAAAMLAKLEALPPDREALRESGAAYDPNGSYSSATAEDVPNDLAFLVGLRQRVKLQGTGPRGLDVVGDDVYCAMYFSDAIDRVDTQAVPRPKATAIAIGPAPVLSIERKGEIFFSDAALCFQSWQSCASCHPDARADALNWDLMNDGMGNPKNAKSMLLAHVTPPTMSLGVRADAETAVRAGIRHIQFAVRPEEDAVAIDEYLKALEPVPSPYLVDGKLSQAAKRGKALFESQETGCGYCHPAPYYTDLQSHDVNSRGPYDNEDEFDTPTLVEVWRTAPYMHDGRYVTMKEVFTDGKHGGVADLTPEQIDDLVEYVLSL